MFELGAYGGEGYSGGLDSMVPWAQESGSSLGAAAVSGAGQQSSEFGSAAEIRNAGAMVAAPSTSQKGGSGGGFVMHVENTFQISGNATPEQARQVGVEAARSFEGEMQAICRRLNYSVGA